MPSSLDGPGRSSLKNRADPSPNAKFAPSPCLPPKPTDDLIRRLGLGLIDRATGVSHGRPAAGHPAELRRIGDLAEVDGLRQPVGHVDRADMAVAEEDAVVVFVDRRLDVVMAAGVGGLAVRSCRRGRRPERSSHANRPGIRAWTDQRRHRRRLRRLVLNVERAAVEIKQRFLVIDNLIGCYAGNS